jgi:hypothetical protein
MQRGLAISIKNEGFLMSNIAEIFFRSLFAHTEVQICSAVSAVFLVGLLLFIAARRAKIKICQANLASINAELTTQPDNIDLYLERAFALNQCGLPLSGLADLETAFERGCSSESLKPAFLQCYWNLPESRVAYMTPWSKCASAAPKLCAELHKADPEDYAPKFLYSRERFAIVDQVSKVERRRTKIK